MSKATQKDRWEFIHLMMKHTTVPEGEAQRAALKLLRYGATYSRIQEFECNAPDARYGQDEYNKRMQECWDRERERLEKREARITEQMKELCKAIGCEVILQGDPRGSTVKIRVPDGFTNDWGREGICVPTS
jgi:hypothetical protein